MSNIIKLKRASSSNPTASDLSVGELAIRTSNCALFSKNDSGSVVQINASQTDNNFTDALLSKLNGIENNATADQSASEIVALIADQTIAPSTIDMEDNEKIKLGNSDDLEIFHSGSGSYLKDVGTGNLELWSNTLVFRNAAGNEVMAAFLENGTAKLYYDNVQTFETTSSGATLTGDFLPEATDTRDLGSNSKKWSEAHLKHYLYMPDDGRIRLGSNYDMQLWHDGSHQILLGKTGNTYITAPSGQSVRLGKSSADNFSAEQMITAYTDGAVELYYDNVKTFHTKQNGVVVEGTEGAGAILEIRADEGDNNNDYFRFFADPSSSNLYVQNYASGSWETNARFIGNGTTELWYDNSKKFETASGGVSITGNITVSGTVDGRDVATDGSKLDGIESGATADQSASEILTLIKTVDGAGSGLDADAVDGVPASSFIRSDQADTATGLLTLSGGIAVSGRVSAPSFGSHGGGTITITFSSSNHHNITLNQNSTITHAGTSNAVGQSGSIFITQDGTGGRTLAFNSAYKFVGGTAPTLSTAANATDRLDYIIKSNGVIHCVLSLDVK